MITLSIRILIKNYLFVTCILYPTNCNNYPFVITGYRIVLHSEILNLYVEEIHTFQEFLGDYFSYVDYLQPQKLDCSCPLGVRNNRPVTEMQPFKCEMETEKDCHLLRWSPLVYFVSKSHKFVWKTHEWVYCTTCHCRFYIITLFVLVVWGSSSKSVSVSLQEMNAQLLIIIH